MVRRPMITLLEKETHEVVKKKTDVALPGITGTVLKHEATYNVRADGTPKASWQAEFLKIVEDMVALIPTKVKWEVHVYECYGATMKKVLAI